MKFIIKKIYQYYNLNHPSKNKKNFFARFHTFFFSSKHTIRYIFGFKIYDELHKRSYPHKYDLTTILLKNFLDRILKKETKKLEILDIGTGYYSLLSIYLKKKFNHNITATDIDPDAITSSKLNCQKNNVKVDLITSDLFENIKDKKFDIIFWNLPYYRDKNVYLKNFLNQVDNFLNDNSKIYLGYNSTPLKPEEIENLTKSSKGIIYVKTKEYFWNMHKISIIKKDNLNNNQNTNA